MSQVLTPIGQYQDHASEYWLYLCPLGDHNRVSWAKWGLIVANLRWFKVCMKYSFVTEQPFDRCLLLFQTSLKFEPKSCVWSQNIDFETYFPLVLVM